MLGAGEEGAGEEARRAGSLALRSSRAAPAMSESHPKEPAPLPPKRSETEASPPTPPVPLPRRSLSLADTIKGAATVARLARIADEIRAESIAQYEYDEQPGISERLSVRTVAHHYHARLEKMVDEEPEEDRKPLLEPPAAAASGSAASCGWLRGKVTPLCAAKWTVILASLAGMCYLWQSGLLRQLLASGQACAAWMRRHPWSLAAFLVVNALLEASLVVSSVSKMVQPFLPVSFGFVLGPAFLLVANFTASLACFVNGRFAVRKWVLRHAGHLRLFRAVDRALAQDASILCAAATRSHLPRPPWPSP